MRGYYSVSVLDHLLYERRALRGEGGGGGGALPGWMVSDVHMVMESLSAD